MLIEEEEEGPKLGSELNSDAIEEAFEGDVSTDDENPVFVSNGEDNEEADEIDIAFAANDEGYW